MSRMATSGPCAACTSIGSPLPRHLGGLPVRTNSKSRLFAPFRPVFSPGKRATAIAFACPADYQGGTMRDTFGTRGELRVGGKSYTIYRLRKLEGYDVERLPYSLRILLENLLRHEDGRTVTREQIEALASWDPKKKSSVEIAFHPERVLLQDFTGVPAVVDFAAMREALKELGGDPDKINPLVPVDLVIDHSVQVDRFATNEAYAFNMRREMERNRERYTFLRWGQRAFRNFRVVPPGTGICHQVNLEFLASCVRTDAEGNAFPDTLVGTDSHTPMVNGLGVLGWGVGGIEAEA